MALETDKNTLKEVPGSLCLYTTEKKTVQIQCHDVIPQLCHEIVISKFPVWFMQSCVWKSHNANNYCVLWDLPFSPREIKSEWIMNKTWKFPEYHHQAQSQTIWILLMINPLWSGSTILESAAGVPLAKLYGSETLNLRRDGCKIVCSHCLREDQWFVLQVWRGMEGFGPFSKVTEKSLIAVEKEKGKELFKLKSNAGMRTNSYLWCSCA